MFYCDIRAQDLVFEQNFGPGLFSVDRVAGSEKCRSYMEQESSFSVKRVMVISTAGHTAFKHPVYFYCTATSWSNSCVSGISVGLHCLARAIFIQTLINTSFFFSFIVIN